MMTGLLVFKDKLKVFYGRFGIYIRHILSFLLAFLSFYIIGRAIGYNSIIASPMVCLAVALVCAFLPVSATVIISTVFIIVHLFGLSIELAVIALFVILIVYLLYFRFAPKTGILLIITPLLFYLKVPYIIPVVAALVYGMTGIIPVISGAFIFYLLDFASHYSTAISTQNADNALQNITFIFNNVLNNKELIVVVVTFSLVIMMIYLIKRLSADHAWIIAIISGCVVDAIVQIIAFSIMSVQFNVISLVVGHIVAILVGLVLNLFIFSVDYSATEYVQFEDNDYYYYVKAVPKMAVSSTNVTVKKINTRQDNKGFIHTESFEDSEDNDSDEPEE